MRWFLVSGHVLVALSFLLLSSLFWREPLQHPQDAHERCSFLTGANLRLPISFITTIKHESGKSQLNAFNKPVYFSNRKEIITIQFASADNVRANPWVHGSDPL